MTLHPMPHEAAPAYPRLRNAVCARPILRRLAAAAVVAAALLSVACPGVMVRAEPPRGPDGIDAPLQPPYASLDEKLRAIELGLAATPPVVQAYPLPVIVAERPMYWGR
jgi:hypothetical protein